MKNPQDPRHKRREKIVADIFAWEFQKTTPRSNSTLGKITKSLPIIDPLIEKAASEWPLSNMSKIDLAIIRLAVYELVIWKKTPHKVIMDEAVEIAKKYGSDTSGAFINGVLGTIYATAKI